MNILLVEDEDIIRDGIVKLIELMPDFKIVKQAKNGKEALAYLRCELPDCIITDIRMQEMDGLTLAGRTKVLYPHIPVIIISGFSDFKYAQQALRHNVHDYLLKPIDRIALITCLQQMKARLRRGESSHTEKEQDAAGMTAVSGEKALL